MNYPYYGIPNYQQNFQQNYQQPQDERIWVQGKSSADAYLVAPNSFVRLWDSQTNVFYEKRADATGRPYMTMFEYKEVTAKAPASNYEDRLATIEKRLQALEGGVNNANESNSNDSTVQSV